MTTHLYAADYAAMTQLIADAIRTSVQQDEIVRIHGGMHTDSIAESLSAECEDEVQAVEIEYYGSDLDGQEWRVHLVRV